MTNKATIHIELALLQDIPVRIEWDYQPAEPMTPTYPGCDAEAELTGVFLIRTGNSIALSNVNKDEIEMRILDGEFDAPTREDLI